MLSLFRIYVNHWQDNQSLLDENKLINIAKSINVGWIFWKFLIFEIHLKSVCVCVFVCLNYEGIWDILTFSEFYSMTWILNNYGIQAHLVPQLAAHAFIHQRTAQFVTNHWRPNIPNGPLGPSTFPSNYDTSPENAFTYRWTRRKRWLLHGKRPPPWPGTSSTDFEQGESWRVTKGGEDKE